MLDEGLILFFSIRGFVDLDLEVGTAKTEVLYLSQNPEQCSLQVNGATLKQVEKFQDLEDVFRNEGKTKNRYTRTGKANAVMRALHYSVVMKRELLKKAKLSIFKTVFVHILTNGHESLVMIERVRSQEQAYGMIFFFRKIERVKLFHKLCRSEIRKSLNIEPLLL